MNKHVGTIVAIVLCIVILGFIAIKGLDLSVVEVPGVETGDGIVLGLDLQGGASITYEATIADPTADQNEAVKSVLQDRLDRQGYTEAVVYNDNNRYTVEVPGQEADEELVALLGKTARLNFRYNGTEIIGSDGIESAEAGIERDSKTGANQDVVRLSFTPEARKAFFTATTSASAAYNTDPSSDASKIFIYLDDEQISAPQVSSGPIDDDSCIITMGGGQGVDTAKEAENLANLINSGKLPFALTEVEKQNISATLGETALNTSINAGIIGFIIVMLFMIGYYRLPGAMASVALLLYMAVFIVLMNILHVNLTLPGIAGIILTIGMAVDANVIIFERIKDELRSGKTIQSSIDSGFHRAMTAIIDSNVTTLIAASVLYFMGTGPIKGFAITLFIGVVLSMFSALFITKWLMKSLAGLKVTNLKAYGA